MIRKVENGTPCKDCGTELIEGVNTYPNNKNYIQSRCKDCHNKHWTERNKQNYDPIKERDRQLRKNFGITLEEYNELWRLQGGVCAICNQESDKALHLDHNHKTGKNRGLLCHNCNRALGFLGESLETIMNMLLILMEF